MDNTTKIHAPAPHAPRSHDRNHQTGGTHYTTMPVQPWDIIIANYSKEERIGFFKGNALKYLLRCGSKDDEVQELKKCQDYINQLMKEYEQDE